MCNTTVQRVILGKSRAIVGLNRLYLLIWMSTCVHFSDPSGTLAKLPEQQRLAAKKQWKEWSRFFPLPEEDNTENLGYVDPVEKEMQERAEAMALPQMLEVTMAGARMYFPTELVLVVGAEDSVGTAGGESASSRDKQSPAKKSSPVKRPLSPDNKSRTDLKKGMKGGNVVERASEELLLCRKSSSAASLSELHADIPSGADEARWDFR